MSREQESLLALNFTEFFNLKWNIPNFCSSKMESDLPREILLHIFSYSRPSLGRIASVSKRWNLLSYDLSLWISATGIIMKFTFH